jgi:mannose-6-phosphate isomerase-like protein (cupin superfamily)
VTVPVQPRFFARGEGRTYQLGRLTVTFKTSAEETAGVYSLCETFEPAGWSAALHRHPSYDETHIVCEGRYECQLGEERLELGPGEMMFVPRGTPHSIRCLGPEAGRELIISTPGGIFEAFIHEAATALSQGPGSPGFGPATDFRAIAAKFGIEFLA